jgi:hypothetical protein
MWTGLLAMKTIFLIFLVLSAVAFAIDSNGTGGGDYTAGASWNGGVAPANGETATVLNGDTIVMDADMSGWANGITLIVNAGGIFDGETAAGTYYLKSQADITNNGEMKAGSSGTAYPNTCTYTIDFDSAANSIECGDTGVISFYCTQPTNKYIALSGLEASGQTVLSVDTDVTSDEWSDGDTIIIVDNDKADDREERIIAAGGIAAGAITVTVGLTNQKEEGALIVLVNRNVKIIGSTNYAIKDMTSASVVGCEISSCTNATSGGDGYELSGVVEGVGRTTNASNRVTISGVVTNTDYGCFAGGDCTISGDLIGNEHAIYVSNSPTISGLVFGGNRCLEEGVGARITGTIKSFTRGIYQASTYVLEGTIENCTYGMQGCSDFRLANATFTNNTNDLSNCFNGTAYNTLFGGATEFVGYDSISRIAWHYVESFDHDQVTNAFKAWCRGGIVTSQTTSPPTGYTIWYEHPCENADFPCYRQFMIVVQPGTAIEVEGKIRIADGEDLSADPPALQIIDYFADPLVDSSNAVLDEDEIPEPDGGVEAGWQDVSVIWANQGDSPRTVFVRMIAQHASADVDEVWDIADYQDQIQSIYDKLPTNYIMGSSDQTDKDDEIDDILTDTSAYDTDAEYAAAIWNALIASYGTAGTYGEEVEELDPNITLILADTDELQQDWQDTGRLDTILDAILTDSNEIQTDQKDGGRLDVIWDAIKYKTDLITIQDTVVKDANDANNFTIEDAIDVNDALWFHIIMVIDADDSHPELRFIDRYDENSTDPNVWVDETFGFTPAAGDVVHIMGTGYGGFLYRIMNNLNQTKGTLNVIDATGGRRIRAVGGVTRIDAMGDDP